VQVKRHKPWVHDPNPAAATTTTSSKAKAETATETTRRRSTGYHNEADRLPFRSNEEEGESSDNSTGDNDGYDSCSSCSQSQSKSQSLEESNKGHFSNAITNLPIDSTRPRKSSENWAGSRNGDESELDSDSQRKRALYEAGMPISVLKGNNSSGNINDNYNNNNSSSVLCSGHPARIRSESDDFQRLRDTLESALSLGREYTTRDDSTKTRSSEDSGVAESGNSGSAIPISTTTLSSGSGDSNSVCTKDREFFLSKTWRSIRKTNPIFLLLVTGVSMLGVGLYTQSYAELSVTLEQVITNTHERRKHVAVRFDDIEQRIDNLQRQLREIDPDANLLMVGGAADDTNGSGSVSHDSTDDKARVTFRDQKAKKHDGKLRQPKESGLFDKMVAMKEKMRIKSSQISAFEKYIQETSLRDATRKYGKGTIRVQLNLVFLSDLVQLGVGENSNSDRNSDTNKNNSGKSDVLRHSKSGDGWDLSSSSSHVLVLEMAPLDVMPHSVFTFLEMVDAKLIDGCSFILNAMNIVKAAPLPYDGSRASQKVKAFTRLGLDTVSFREYSSNYPHEKFTVGFAADGSPDFYINTENNTELHAGEPCFAKIVSGFEAVERMEMEPVRSGMWYKKRIGIQKAVIV